LPVSTTRLKIVKQKKQLVDRSAAAQKLYLDLMENVLVGSIYNDPPLPIFGSKTFDPTVRELGEDWPSNAYSMIGAKRMNNFRVLIERVISDGIEGDIMETGVWRGGACILARAVLAAYGVKNRKVILADSFEGLPPPDTENYPKDSGSRFHEYKELAITIDTVRENFRKFGLLDEQVVMLKGWFKDTMPLVVSKQIAVLRLDGDMYESTMTPLRALYDRVPSGGWVIVDDYNVVPECKAAIHDFFKERNLSTKLIEIDRIGVYFQKN
jgi:O-methyltransferase